MRTGILIAALVFSPLLEAAVKSEPVSYESNGTTLKGFIAWDDSISGKRPAVLVA